MNSENGNGNPVQQTVQGQIVIRLLSDGQVQISGPLNNKVLMYGLLDCAKDVVREMNTKQEKPLVTPVTIMPRFEN